MKEKELKLEIEELEERIAPTFVIDPGMANLSADGATDGTPVDPNQAQGNGVGPVPATFPTREGGGVQDGSADPNARDAAWNSHSGANGAGNTTGVVNNNA